MRRVGIESLADRSVLELSGGERQLVLLARALAQDPRVLLLDEPTAHLDLRHRVRVAALVRELVREGRSALVVSHDLGLAARSGDRIALLRGGELRALGTPREVLTPANMRAIFDVETEILDGHGRRAPGRPEARLRQVRSFASLRASLAGSGTSLACGSLRASLAGLGLRSPAARCALRLLDCAAIESG